MFLSLHLTFFYKKYKKSVLLQEIINKILKKVFEHEYRSINQYSLNVVFILNFFPLQFLCIGMVELIRNYDRINM